MNTLFTNMTLKTIKYKRKKIQKFFHSSERTLSQRIPNFPRALVLSQNQRVRLNVEGICKQKYNKKYVYAITLWDLKYSVFIVFSDLFST